jgi:hypothetical protein
MSSSYYHNFNAHQHATATNAHPGTVHNRSRRNARLPQNNHNNKQYNKIAKREEEAATIVNYRQRFDLARSFDLEDDAEFCPNLLTESDMVSINSSSSDRSSLSSGSPSSSPQSTQVNLSPSANFSLNSNSHPFVHSGFNVSTLKLHQPAATRMRNAIPIVNPNDGALSSPPASVSPSRMHQHQQQSMARRW